jgi:hypothetical protein
MRNKFAFHTDAALLLESFASVPAGFTYETLLGQDYQGHNVFSGSEIIIIDGVQHLHPRAHWDDAIHSIFLDTTYISNLIAKVFQRIIGTIMTKHLGITLDDAKNVTVTDGPPIDAVVIPFFLRAAVGGNWRLTSPVGARRRNASHVILLRTAAFATRLNAKSVGRFRN